MRIMDINKDTKFRPSDLNNSKYTGRHVFNRNGKPPMFIMMSRECNPPHYMVIDGIYKQMFFLKYSEAVDYCKQRGYHIAD